MWTKPGLLFYHHHHYCSLVTDTFRLLLFPVSCFNRLCFPGKLFDLFHISAHHPWAKHTGSTVSTFHSPLCCGYFLIFIIHESKATSFIFSGFIAHPRLSSCWTLYFDMSLSRVEWIFSMVFLFWNDMCRVFIWYKMYDHYLPFLSSLPPFFVSWFRDLFTYLKGKCVTERSSIHWSTLQMAVTVRAGPG